MAWPTTDPSFLSAPGFSDYADTAAYQYQPGLDFDPTYTPTPTTEFSYELTGDETIDDLKDLINTAGTLNTLSTLTTGKSLLEHAGVPNPLSAARGLLGGDGLNLQALNPASDVPLTALLGDAGRNLGLASSAFPNALPGGVGGSVGIGPSGYLSPDALAGISNPVTTPVTVAPTPTPTVPVGSPQLGAAPLEAVHGPYELGPLPEPVPQGVIDAGQSMAEAITGAETGMPTNPYSVSGGPTPAPSLGLVGNQAAMASLFPGAVGTSALAAAPGFATLAPGVTAIPSMGGALAGALGPAAAAPAAAGGASSLGALGGAGAMLPLAGAGLLFAALKGLKKKDPANNRKLMLEAEKYAKKAKSGDVDALRFLQGRVFGPHSAHGEGFLNLMALAASDSPDFISGQTGYAPFGSDPDKYPHHIMGWSPELSDWFKTEFLPDAPKIFAVRQQLEKGLNFDEPLLVNPYTAAIGQNWDPMTASRMSGITSADVEAMGFKPPGWVAWDQGLDDPNDSRFIDAQGGAF
jgi:hypothetical protein